MYVPLCRFWTKVARSDGVASVFPMTCPGRLGTSSANWLSVRSGRRAGSSKDLYRWEYHRDLPLASVGRVSSAPNVAANRIPRTVNPRSAELFAADAAPSLMPPTSCPGGGKERPLAIYQEGSWLSAIARIADIGGQRSGGQPVG